MRNIRNSANGLRRRCFARNCKFLRRSTAESVRARKAMELCRKSAVAVMRYCLTWLVQSTSAERIYTESSAVASVLLDDQVVGALTKHRAAGEICAQRNTAARSCVPDRPQILCENSKQLRVRAPRAGKLCPGESRVISGRRVRVWIRGPACSSSERKTFGELGDSNPGCSNQSRSVDAAELSHGRVGCSRWNDRATGAQKRVIARPRYIG